jgi:hypothetical protein
MTLQDFYMNEVLRGEVKTYLLDYFKVEAIERTFNRESTAHIADAKEIVEKAFDNLELLFQPKSEVKELKNGSR